MTIGTLVRTRPDGGARPQPRSVARPARPGASALLGRPRRSRRRGAWSPFVVALLVSIVLHELGHYLGARWGGMKVTEYFIGFGPRIWSIRRGETEYGLKAIPLGAYVKVPGHEQPRGGPAGGRGPHLPGPVLRAAAAHGVRRAGHEPAGRAGRSSSASSPSTTSRSSATPAGRPSTRRASGDAGRHRRARRPATGSCAMDGVDVTDFDTFRRPSAACRARPCRSTIERGGQTRWSCR